MPNSLFQNSRYADTFFRYQIRPKYLTVTCDMSGPPSATIEHVCPSLRA